MSPARTGPGPAPADATELTDLALGCVSAERAGSAGWPAGEAVSGWIRARLADGSPPGTAVAGSGGRFDTVAVTRPDLVVEPEGAGAGWSLRRVGTAEGTELTDPAVRRWRGTADRDAPAEPVAEPGDLAGRLATVTDVACAAALVGVAGRALDLAVTRGRERTQFGRPIGSFQSIAHRLADMYCAVELAHSSVLVAAATGAPADARRARLLAARTMPGVAGASVHVHGAVGLTAEVPVHAALRRALVLRALGPSSGPALDDLRGDLRDFADLIPLPTPLRGAHS